MHGHADFSFSFRHYPRTFPQLKEEEEEEEEYQAYESHWQITWKQNRSSTVASLGL